MRVERGDDGGVVLLDGDELVAEARPAELDLEDPGPVSPHRATEAAERFPFAGDDHAFPSCFVCGPDREHGDGLRIFAGPVGGEDGVHAAPWTPDASLAGPEGDVLPEFVWASLDCPTAAPVANPGSVPPIVLARMTARVEGAVRAGEPHVLVSWPLGRDGRKRHAASALYSADGERLGAARALWIELS